MEEIHSPTFHHGPRVSLTDLWTPRGVASLFLAGEALAAVLALSPGRSSDRLAYFGVLSVAVQWAALGSLGALYLLRKRAARLLPVKLAWVWLALFVAMTELVSIISWSVLYYHGVEPKQSLLEFVLQSLALVIIVGLVALFAYQHYWHSRQMQLRIKQLELAALQERVHPHFLFNALNTVIALVPARPDVAEKALMDLSDLLRYSLRGSQEVLLPDEIDLTLRYLDIEWLRLGDRLRLHLDIPERIPDIAVPSLCIQPLVENAIRHAIEKMPGGGDLGLGVAHEGDFVVVTVSNDKALSGAASRGHSIGLSASRERVQAFTSGRGRVDVSDEGGRFVVRIYFPVT